MLTSVDQRQAELFGVEVPGHVEIGGEKHNVERAIAEHLGHLFGHLDVALVEVASVTEDGDLVPSSSVGNNKTWLDLADRVMLGVNSWQPIEMEGVHDICYGTALPQHRTPIEILHPADRIGVPHLRCDPEKIVAVVETNAPDRNSPFNPLDGASQQIAGHVLEFLGAEVSHRRLPPTLLPLQSGVGNVANAVLIELDLGPFRPLTPYTEVIQDGMLQLLGSAPLEVASATAFALSEASMKELRDNFADYGKRIVLRPQQIRNRPEVIRRLGCLAMNGMIEADIYGNVNSTHVMGSRIQNGIGGSQRLRLYVRQSLGGQRRSDLLHRADGQPRRPHRARRERHRHRTGHCRPARPASPSARPADHRPLRAPGLPGCPAGLLRPGSGDSARQAHSAPAR